jgi:hypothetical protein
MAIVDVPVFFFPPAFPLSQAGGAPVTGGTDVVNTSALIGGWMIEIPKDGTIDTATLHVNALTIDPASVLRVALRSVTQLPTDMDPSGTEDQYRDLTDTELTGAPLTVETGLLTNTGADGGTKRTVTAGEIIAVTWRWETFTAGDSIQMTQMNTTAFAAGAQWKFNTGIPVRFTGSAWAQATNTTLVAGLKYSTGEYVQLWPWIMPGYESNTEEGSITGNKEVGLQFKLPFSARLRGVGWFGAMDAEPVAYLYDSGDTKIAESNSEHSDSAGNDQISLNFTSPVTLTADTIYKVVARSEEADSLSVHGANFSSNAIMAASGGGKDFTWIQRADSTIDPFTETTTRRPWMWLVLDGLDDGSSGGLVGGTMLNRGLN